MDTEQVLNDSPLAMMVPMREEAAVPAGWLALDGGPLDPVKHAAFIEVLRSKMQDTRIRQWWDAHGGSEEMLPLVPSDEVYIASFGIEPQEMKMKLVIKAERTVING